MQANSNGIALTKAELRALREFSSKEPTDRNRFGVQFTVEGDAVYARASDSRRCIEIQGINEGFEDGEWFVDQKFLIDGRKLLEGKQVLCLCFSGASLHEAIISENGVTRETLQSEADAAIAQANFPFDTIKLPSPRREKVHCAAVAAPHLKAIELAAAAVEEEMVDVFSPSNGSSLLIFRAGEDKATSVVGGILPGVSAEAAKSSEDGDGDGDGDDDEDKESPKRDRRKKASERQQEMPGTNGSAEEASPELA